MKTAHVLWQAVTPVHVGTGQDGSGIIDLPVAREASTGYPTLPASGLKGVIRNEAEASDPDNVIRLFGDTKMAGDFVFHDARLLALPVRSIWGTFALVTCPLVLRRLKRDLALMGFEHGGLDVPTLPNEQGIVPLGSVNEREGRILIDDFIIQVTKKDVSGSISYLAKADPAILDNLTERLVIVPDDVFAFLARYRLPVFPHVKIDESTGTVARGALWYEEVIPEEALLTSFVTGSTDDPQTALGRQTLLQVGGHRSVGRGLVTLCVRATLGETAAAKEE